MKAIWTILALTAALWLTATCAPVARVEPAPSLFVSGLNQPRGMVFDAQGNLYVAEAGARQRPEAGETAAEINHSGRVLRISPGGKATTVVDGLPYTYSRASGDVGATDVALIGDTLYVLTGEGYDDELSRRVLHVRAQRAPRETPQLVANLLNFAIGMSSSTEQVLGSVTSNPFGLAAAGDGSALFVTDGATGRILRVTLDGQIRVFGEAPGTQGSPPPLTGLAFGPDGRLYVGMFSALPHAPGSGEVWAAEPSGEMPRQMSVVARGLTMPIDVGFDPMGALYVLEFGDGQEPENPYAPGGGRLLRVASDGARVVLLDGLDYPTSLAFSPTGDLYVTTGGAFREAGEGAILKVPCAALGAGRCAAGPIP